MNFKTSNFYVRSVIFSVLSAGAALLNYLLYPAISRFLDTASFGDFTALNALSNQILGILLAFNLTSIYLVKKFSEEDARSNAQAIQRILIWVFVGASLAFLIFSPFIGSKLKIDSPVSFLVVALILLSAVPAVMWTGYLQGHKQLINVGVFNFSAASGKLIFALIFAGIFGAVGGLLGVLAGTCLGLVVLRLSTKRKLPSLGSIFHKPSHRQADFLRSSKYYIAGSVLIVGGMSFLQNLDITYAKYLFDPNVAGAYSGVSILSNTLYYVFFLLIWIIIPEIDIEKTGHNRKLLGNAYKLIGGLGALALVFISLLQNHVVDLLLGGDFSQYSSLLVFGALYQISLIAITLYAYYLLILRSHKSLILSICTILPCIIVPLFYAHNPRQLIISLCISIIAGFGIYWIIILLLGTRGKHGQEITS